MVVSELENTRRGVLLMLACNPLLFGTMCCTLHDFLLDELDVNLQVLTFMFVEHFLSTLDLDILSEDTTYCKLPVNLV